MINNLVFWLNSESYVIYSDIHAFTCICNKPFAIKILSSGDRHSNKISTVDGNGVFW